MPSLSLVSAPAIEPIDLTQAKDHMRVDINYDDGLIRAMVEAARVYVEQTILNRALITQTWDLYLDQWPAGGIIHVPRPPLQSITYVKYYDDDGTENTFASSSYQVDTTSEPGRIALNVGESWPGNTLRSVNGILVRFVAGYGAAATAVPGPIRQSILLLAGDLYENRENSVVGSGISVNAVPTSAQMLLSSYRIPYWGWRD